jgi:PII-like signaling protein
LPVEVECTLPPSLTREGKLPLVLVFVDEEEHVNRVLPTLREMAPKRLILRETVHIEQGLE